MKTAGVRREVVRISLTGLGGLTLGAVGWLLCPPSWQWAGGLTLFLLAAVLAGWWVVWLKRLFAPWETAVPDSRQPRPQTPELLKAREALAGAWLHDDSSAVLSRVSQILTETLQVRNVLISLFSHGHLAEFGFSSQDDTVGLPIQSFEYTLWPKDFQAPLLVNQPRPHLLDTSLVPNLLAWPLHDGHEFFGIIELTHKPGGFGPSDMEFLKDLAPEIAVATRMRLRFWQEAKRSQSIQRALVQSRQRLEFLLEDSPDAIFTANLQGRILSANQACDRFFQPGGEPVSGRNLRDFLFNPGDFDIMLARLKSRQLINDFELIFDIGGSQRYTTLAITPDYDSGTSFREYQVVLRDITERVMFSQQLLETNMELMEVNRQLKDSQSQLYQQEKMASIGQLAAGIAHEINNPLGFVKSNFNTLKASVTHLEQWLKEQGEQLALPRRIQEDLEDIEAILRESDEGFERIMSIVKSLKSFSRIDQEGDRPALVDLNAALETTLVVARNEYKYVATVETVWGDIPEVECLGNQMNQVFLNLLVNAAQALASRPEGAPAGKITLRTWCQDRQVCIEFADNGPGIAPEHLSRLFEPFFTTKDVGKGTGLGLSISHDIVVNKHLGRIEVGGQPGQGAIFRVWLPVRFLGPKHLDTLEAF